LKKWHGPAREITRKMRVPPQTDPLPAVTNISGPDNKQSNGLT